jgi:hypothetical protein
VITKVFLIVELILRLFKIWDKFGSYVDQRRAAEMEARAQAREKAIEKLKQAKTPDEIWKAQEELVKNGPRP